MKRLLVLVLLSILSSSIAEAAIERIPAGERPDCTAGGPLVVFLTQQSSATDCDATGGGSSEALCCCANGSWAACDSGGGGGGSGTVTSVGLSVPAEWSVSGSPVTTSGTITIAEATQSANTCYAGPTSGGAAAPGFRALVAADLPAGDYLPGSSSPAVDASGGVWGGSGVLAFEGSTADTSETVLFVEDPTADRFVQIPNLTGYVQLSDCATCYGTAANSVMTTTNGILFEGTTANGFETTLLGGDPTADRSITLPNETGTVLTSASNYAASVSPAGPATTATALAANPPDCSTSDGTVFAWRINASGDLGCTSVAYTSSTLDRDATSTTIVSSAAETTIYSYTIPAGTVDANGELRLTLLNEWFNNSGSSRSLDLRVKLGGSTVIAWNSGNFITSATRRPIRLEVRLNAMNATNSQRVWLWGDIPAFTAVGTISTGSGSVTTAITSLNITSGDLTQDMTTSKVLEVTIQHSASNASLEWKTYSGTLELLDTP